MNDETKVRSAKAKESTSWTGYRVRLLRDLTTQGGHIFLAGTEMTVLKCFKGLNLVDDAGRRIYRVQKFEVLVVAKKPETAVVSEGRKQEEKAIAE